MLAIVIVGMIFVSAVVTIPAISYVNLRQVDQQQLRNTALNLFNAMLLGTGSPNDWGSNYPFNQSEVNAFGLALPKQSTLYTLDINKLQRLQEIGPGQIEYEKVRELLGLQDYGFQLSIYRPFRVDWTIDIDEHGQNPIVEYSVDVGRNLDQRPIQGAQINITLLCIAKNPAKVDEPILKIVGPRNSITNALGHCEGSESIEWLEGEENYELESAMAIFKINVSGISTLVVAYDKYSIHNIVNVHSYGDTLVLSFRDIENTSTSAVRRLIDVLTYDFNENLNMLYDSPNPGQEKITHGFGYWTWEKTFPGLRYVDPALLMFLVQTTLGSESQGLETFLITGPLSLWENSEVLFFGSEDVGDVTAKLRRYVIDVSGMMYNAELIVWKE